MASTKTSTNTNNSQNYHHGNLREALLIDGLRLLESSEGANFSMRELTRMIGVSANAVYRHFKSKEELLVALAIQGFQSLLEQQALAIQNAKTAQEGFLNSGKTYIDFAIKNPSLFRLMYGRFAVNQNDESLNSLAQLAYTGILYSASTALNLDVNSQHAKTIATSSWGVVHGLSHLIIDGQFNAMSAQQLNEMIDTIIEGLYSSQIK